MDAVVGVNKVSRRKTTQAVTFCIKKERNALFKKVSTILQKPEAERSEEEKEVLRTCSDLVVEVNQRLQKRQKVKARQQEFEDPPNVLAEKCAALAEAISASQYLVVYTGAGISTAACIPDYRGTNGIWTLLQQGKDIGIHDLSLAEPTLTHMALSELFRKGLLKHIVSQNCDGLHLRSGLPRNVLSEVHGNMYIEVCRNCKPQREYIRLFDVTENTARYNHRTMRRCYICRSPLIDTIVHFGERGTLRWPLNWAGACDAADKADVILCVGSSLKVLKKYPWLWCMDKPIKKRPKLYIINLQWTPKDDQAVLKINGKCDEVMTQVMSKLNIPISVYDRGRDPLFFHSTSLHPDEEHTKSQPLLKQVDTSLLSASSSQPCLESSQKAETSHDDALSPKIEDKHVCEQSNNVLEKPIIIEIVDCKTEEDIRDLLLDGSSEPDLIDSVKTEETFASSFSDISKGDSENCKIEAVSIECVTLPVEFCEPVIKDEFVKSSLESCPVNKSSCINVLKCNVMCSDQEHTVENVVGLKSVFDERTRFSINSILSGKLESSIKADKTNWSTGESSEYSTSHMRLSKVKDNASKRTSCWPDPLMTILNLPENELSDNSTAASTKRSRVSSKKLCCISCVQNENSNNRIRSNSVSSETRSRSKTSKKPCDTTKTADNTTKCSYCTEYYNSQQCQFYTPHVPEFNVSGKNVDPGKCICECCDVSDDDEEEEVENDQGECFSDVLSEAEMSEVQLSESGMDSTPESTSKSTGKVPCVNPGWYGKGYRKRIRRK